VATISPSETSIAETLSTLQFAQRAKRIRNSAVVNEDVSGNLQALQREVVALRNKLAACGDRPVIELHDAGLDGVASTRSLSMENNSAYIDLPSSALLRCRTMEEERDQALEALRALEGRNGQIDNVFRSLKMQLKMREADLAKAKKGLTDSTAGEEAQRVDLDALREQLTLDMHAYKSRAEEAERR
jgi:hypothetical protein